MDCLHGDLDPGGWWQWGHGHGHHCHADLRCQLGGGGGEGVMQMRQVMIYVSKGVSGGELNEGSKGMWATLAGGAIIVIIA